MFMLKENPIFLEFALKIEESDVIYIYKNLNIAPNIQNGSKSKTVGCT